MTAWPTIDSRLCTGCGDCVAVCPTDCLAMTGPTPWLPKPLDCVSCAICELICPVAAIQMKPASREPASSSV
jgi:NAD-dependent dihydropyrimidine dehydrogenase PreA subunit